MLMSKSWRPARWDNNARRSPTGVAGVVVNWLSRRLRAASPLVDYTAAPRSPVRPTAAGRRASDVFAVAGWDATMALPVARGGSQA